MMLCYILLFHVNIANPVKSVNLVKIVKKYYYITEFDKSVWVLLFRKYFAEIIFWEKARIHFQVTILGGGKC